MIDACDDVPADESYLDIIPGTSLVGSLRTCPFLTAPGELQFVATKTFLQGPQ